MALEINEQYRKFVQFAELQKQAGTEKAIARDGGEAANGGQLAGHSIKAATGDKVAPLWRSRNNKDANNITRSLFRQTIIDIFGGEANIPANVRNAMKLKDYDHGKPLTARRILMVKAEIDKIAATNATTNANIAQNISNGRIDLLPQDMQDGLASLVDHLRDVFGEAVVPAGKTINKIVNATNVASGIKALVNAANAQGRVIATADLISLYDQKALERLATEVSGNFILAKAKARTPEISNTARSIGAQFEARHPGLHTRITQCTNPAEVEAVFQDYETQINAFVDLIVRSNAADKAVESKATAKLAAALGLDARFIAAHVPMDDLCAKARSLTSDIAAGTAPECKDQGYDVEAAYDALIDEFVQKRLDACAAIDSLDLPDDVKNRWKAEYTSYSKVPPIPPAQLLEVSKVFNANVGALKDAISSELSPQDAAKALKNIVKTLNDTISSVTGNPHFFDEVGVDEKIPIYGMLLTAAEAKTPDQGQAIRNAGEAFFNPVDDYCEEHEFDTAVFVKALNIKNKMGEKPPVTDKDKYLAAVEKETDAALAECGITDAKVCKDVKDTMRKLGSDALASATELKSLSDFIATAKTKAVELAKKLDGIVKEGVQP
ncbi:MAG: hypothetical protein K6G44_02050 [Lentisphaeria bacterium]|nr:hypothetical protein [Lentisphaeria bacterium]